MIFNKGIIYKSLMILNCTVKNIILCTTIDARRCMLLGRIVKTEDGGLHVAFRDKVVTRYYAYGYMQTCN